MGSRTSMVSRSNATVITIVQSRSQSRILIGFWCTVSEFENTSHSQCIGPLELIRA
ncbi:hypothetical protein BHE74_00021184 [Ensete ventricosum]|nr:hypothetical protein GW17_00055416 [Ensete ventricosum]RWW71102.1 hypothetical protein BHE74_00021184 [Ensete ventricosum]